MTSGVNSLSRHNAGQSGVSSLGGVGISPAGFLNAGSLSLPQVCEALTTRVRHSVVREQRADIGAPMAATPLIRMVDRIERLGREIGLGEPS